MAFARQFARPRRVRSRPVALRRRYSRFVAMMKLVLPLSAAVFVALVVAWPYMTERDEGLGISFADIKESESGTLSMTNARYLGTDGKNQPFTVTAETATQEPSDPERIVLKGLQADILLANGDWLALTADSGVFNHETKALQLNGAVSFYADQGYELHTASARIDFNAGLAEGQVPIEGQGPLGLLTAAGFRAVDKGERIYFTGRVKLILYPAAGG
ncbi:MAG: LPS export ABC transporter periplasmic protein LptC [Alphaproteobacteria bacterium]